ncbi:LOW QUALITY PROTEIN: hypothetical protein MAR_018357 [Mya arenaria]|uniref:Uncharacterized protein n=1 Tax=Mya arenaria TaxID=6604 RepID=A0ABY7EGW4_MYAAR|nr:LOW QUALITY PROTEIN: hypothetical protein MAR_018357 [Mya arenaria]
MIYQLGLLTFFATFSAAETRWTDLLHLLSSVSPKGKLEDFHFCGIPTERISTFALPFLDVSEENTQFIQLQIHRHSKSCKKKGKEICRFVFPLPPMKETMILEHFDSNPIGDAVKTSKQSYKKVLEVMKSLAKDETSQM